ncbi:MAG: hypothetical protein WB347_13345 [Terriglobales bacterium]
MTQRQRSQQVWVKWRKLVREQGRSGQSVVEFCRERRLCAPYFYAWKKRLREADAGREAQGAPLPKFVEVQVTPGGWGQAGASREVGAASRSRAAGDARVEVLLQNGRSLRVGPGFDVELVRALLAVVESVA